MMVTTFNPFRWDKDNSSLLVTSAVCSLELNLEGLGEMNVSDLGNDIEITIPINSNGSESTESDSSFLKPSQMTIRRYYAELANVPVSLRLVGLDKVTWVEVFIKFGSRPTIEDFDQKFIIAFNTTCQNASTDGNGNYTDCTFEPVSITVVPTEPTVVYVGMRPFGEGNTTEHSRKRRSCFGNGRERRSCVGVKDPPPKGFNKTVVPQYDFKYTMSISQANCLYWLKTEEKWTSKGCKVAYLCCYFHVRFLHTVTTFFMFSFFGGGGEGVREQNS